MALIDAVESIETDYETLRGVPPKSEYQELDSTVLSWGYPFLRSLIAHPKGKRGIV